MSELARQIRAQIDEKTAQRNALTKEILTLEHDLGLLQEAVKRERKREKYYAWLAENDTDNVARYALWMQDDPDDVIRLLLERDVPVRVILKTIAFVFRTSTLEALGRMHNSREVVRIIQGNLSLLDEVIPEVQAMVEARA